MPVTTDHPVVIAGAGPTGMMLAAELKLAGIDALVLERRAHQDVLGTRARGLHARTIELLDQRGIADRFLAEGKPAQVAGFGHVRLDISDFPTRHPYGLALFQQHVERILLGWVEELGVTIRRGAEVTGLVQDESGVTIGLADGPPLRADYLVGCDGGRSFVRKAAGIAFPGWDASVSHLIAEVELSEQPPEWGMRQGEHGLSGLSPAEDGKVGVLVTEPKVGSTDEPTLADLSAALIAVYGTDYGVKNPVSLSRFTDMARQAEHYRRGRVLLAGDAAHVHYPAGGQGLNLGMQDAANLGWKLAQVVKGVSSDTLLDSYHDERHPVAATVLRDTMAAVAIGRQDDRSKALHAVVADLLGVDAARKHLAGRMSGLDVHYDLGAGHPLLGRRMPDLDLVTANGALRVYTLFHQARPALISLGTPTATAAPWADRVQLVEATTAGAWELPVIGEVAAPTAVLIRPDGYVAWVGRGSDTGLTEALTRWFGPA